MPRSLLVDEEHILSFEQLLTEKWKWKNLCLQTANVEDTLSFLAKHRLVRNTCSCPNCNVPCYLNKYSAAVNDGVRWMCPRCKKYSQSVRANSFFSKSNLPLDKIIYILYLWSRQSPQYLVQDELDLSQTTVVDWYNFARDVTVKWIEDNPPKIGGFDENLDAIIVEIDETVLRKRKYNRGQHIAQKWLFGGIQRGSRKCFLYRVPDRRSETLIPFIENCILAGSRIMSDGLASYNSISHLQGGVYSHDVIIHDTNFVHPNNSDIHTQNIESLWSRLKYMFKNMRETNEPLLDSYLCDFMWRSNFCSGYDVFSSLLYCIATQYPF
jgi:transposase-like protein